jgi:hypothetical protein
MTPAACKGMFNNFVGNVSKPRGIGNIPSIHVDFVNKLNETWSEEE